ncbi:MAG: PilZ domain-containing protein [Vicinamibacteria bacterium]
MKSELDLVREFSELNEAKVDSWGTLPAASEKRFQELKAYFEELMGRRSGERIPLLDRHETFEIRNAIAGRNRLRIPADMNLFFCHGDAYAPARAVNLSRGGILLGADVTLERGDRLTIYMPNLGRGYENLFETTVDVVWTARERRLASRGMGVSFRELGSEAEDELDDFVVAFLRDRISKSASVAHRPGWIAERRVIV